MPTDVGNILFAITGLALGALGCWVAMRKALDGRTNQIRSLMREAEDMQRRHHLVEREHAKELTRVERDYADSARRACEAAREEGRKIGRLEGEQERIRERNKMEEEFAVVLRDACKRSADEARDQARRDFEQQAKLFSVEVQPYYEVTEVSQYFKTEYEARTGYQYQLRVNGIPAFQPHVIIESTERRKKSKDENIDRVASRAAAIALDLAQGAISNLLGGASSFVKLGKLVQRLPGKVTG